MKRSESITALAAAMCKAQAEMHNPAFDSKNPHFKSSYASLASVRNTVLPVLAKHGISLIQDLVTVEDGVKCVNLLMHTSGEWIETEGITVPVDRRNAHGMGSASTYARRFSLMALVTVVGDVDDDGNTAVAAPPEPKGAISATQGALDSLPTDEREYIQELALTVVDILHNDCAEAANERIKSENLDADQKTALWSLLDSKTRSALKKTTQEK